MKYLIGTRGSLLSLTQTNWVVSELKNKSPQTEFDILTIKTQGDTDARPLFTINQKGIFEKEIDRAVAEKKVDFAVHSLKDIPADLPEDLVLACIPKREEANDVFISRDGSTLGAIKKGSLVGTSSLRRAVQITRVRPDLVVKPIRGNIETRIRLPMDTFPPSPGQGALGIVSRRDNSSLIELLQKIEDPESRNAVEAERSLSMFVDSGCRFPVGAFAHRDNDRLKLRVIVYSIDGSKSIMVEKDSETSKANDLGKQAAAELRERGIADIAKDWREKVEEWNSK